MKLKSPKEAEQILLDIYSLYPNIKTELNFSTPFQFLIAVILSAQTTDKQVNVVTDKFFKTIRKPADLVGIELSDIEKSIGSVNFYKNKSKSIKGAADVLMRDFNSVIPNNLELIQKLPGVGIKTAKVVLGVLYDAPFIGVDTHVHRICNRIGICKTFSPEKTDEYLEKTMSLETKRKVHHALVLFGRYTCISRKPKCETCKINPRCNYYKSLKIV